MSTHHGLYQMFLKFEIFVYRYCQLIPFHHSSSDFNISPQCGFPLLSQQRESFLKYLLCVFKKKSIIWCQSKNCVYSVNSKVSTESTEYVLSKFLATWYCCNSGVVWKFWSAKALGDSENQMYWYTTLWECMLSHVRLFVTPWTVACQTPLCIGFPKQEYWSGLSFPIPGDLPDSGILSLLPWQVYSLPLWHLEATGALLYLFLCSWEHLLACGFVHLFLIFPHSN